MGIRSGEGRRGQGLSGGGGSVKLGDWEGVAEEESLDELGEEFWASADYCGFLRYSYEPGTMRRCARGPHERARSRGFVRWCGGARAKKEATPAAAATAPSVTASAAIAVRWLAARGFRRGGGRTSGHSAVCVTAEWLASRTSWARVRSRARQLNSSSRRCARAKKDPALSLACPVHLVSPFCRRSGSFRRSVVAAAAPAVAISASWLREGSGGAAGARAAALRESLWLPASANAPALACG